MGVKDALTLTGAALAALFFSGCGSGSTYPAPSRLAQAQARWQSAGVSHYAFTLERSCFCPPDYSGPVRIEVKNGSVVSITRPDDSPVTDDYFSGYDTVEELFGVVESAEAYPASALITDFDPDRGFPTRISIDYIALAVDDEISYRISDFNPLP
jgi:hypothetical protein